VSINNIAAHFSPLSNEAEAELKDGDLVKVELGTHIDGYAAVGAHSFIVGATKVCQRADLPCSTIFSFSTLARMPLRLVARLMSFRQLSLLARPLFV